LDSQFDAALARFDGSEVPRPDYWGGYRIVPSRIEFWKGRSNRMHDRIAFKREVDGSGKLGEWQIQRLQP
jgi:pyridoxamine 5'-phosphate oxidase